MKKQLFVLLFAGTLATPRLEAQVQGVSIGPSTQSPDPSAMLDVQSSNKGVLVPRVTLTATNLAAPVVNPAISLLIYNPGGSVAAGYYYWDGAQWKTIGGNDLWFQTGALVHRPLPVGIGNNPARPLVEFPATDPFYPGEANGLMVLRSDVSWDNGNPAHKRVITFAADGNEINATNEGHQNAWLFLNYHDGSDVRVGGYNPSMVSDLQVQGTVTAAGFITGSDERLKTNIQSIKNALPLVTQLRGVTFNWKERENDPLHYGLIAQEVEKVIPPIVGVETIDRSKAPNRIAYKHVDYIALVPLLIEAVKEQQLQIEKLEKAPAEYEEMIKKQQKQLEEQDRRLRRLESIVRNMVGEKTFENALPKN